MIDTQLHQKFAGLVKINQTQTELFTAFSRQLDRIEQMLTALCLQHNINAVPAPPAQKATTNDAASSNVTPIVNPVPAAPERTDAPRTMAPTVVAPKAPAALKR